MIQPNDIRSQAFKKGLFGYKATEVDEFKSTVARALEEAQAESAKLKEENERLKKESEESRLKVHELEKQLAGDSKENAKKGDAKKGDAKSDKKKGFEEIKGAKDDKKADSSATSKFFEQAAETTVIGDDEEVFTGDVEEARKPGKAMIGDGEEEGGDDFTFL
jgi:DivIVA domain-containing protein